MDDGRRRLLRAFDVDLGERVMEDASYDGVSASRSGTTVISVPEGFDTDFSSIPALGRWFMGRWDRHDIAGVIHDYLYRIGVPRRAADRAWRIVAEAGTRNVGAVRGFLGWAGLRIGGWVAYRKRAQEREA
jgi:hypothetical protein